MMRVGTLFVCANTEEDKRGFWEKLPDIFLPTYLFRQKFDVGQPPYQPGHLIGLLRFYGHYGKVTADD